MEKPNIPSRIASIDIFRALTMLLMIFVNALGYLDGIPDWLEHAPRNADAMGLADIVFPCFLFLVGMSIPFAIKSRIKKGESNARILYHVIIRTVSLLIMGVFHENINYINAELTGMSQAAWQLFVNVSFILVWNIYPTDKPNLKKLFAGLRLMGIASLVFLAIIFRGGKSESPFIFMPHWWGILGLIGWTYLICTILFLYSNKKFVAVIIGFFVFITFNVLCHSGVITFSQKMFTAFKFLGQGAFASLSLGGVLASLIYIRAKENNKLNQFYLVILSLSVITFIAGFYTRPFWGISKLRETPAWVFYSLSVSYAVFCLLFWLTDVKGYKNIFNIIKPAGTSTLLCYIIPYIYDSIVELSGVNLPAFINYGIVGLIKTAMMAFLLIILTGILGKVNVKMKL